MTEVPPGKDELASALIAVHGGNAAGVARENARSAAVAGQADRAKAWLRVVAVIQRDRAGIP